MFVVHDTLPNQRKMKKCPLIKSYLFSYGNGFFSKLRVCYAFIVHEVEKNTFFEWIFHQNL
jgi:hypothetical protein